MTDPLQHIGAPEATKNIFEGFVVECECGHKSSGETEGKAYQAHAWHGTHSVLSDVDRVAELQAQPELPAQEEGTDDGDH